ncbi:MAG: ABC transporter permease subunit, partial [Clostridiales bacterium]|nr:ABC transporter permease subunit [Clostridiales bacterium]
MSKLIYLINMEVRRFRWTLAVMVVILISFQQILLGISAGNNYRYVPYEEFFNSSGAVIVFGLAFAACCALSIWSIVYNYHGSKSIYTLVTRPQKRSQLYLSKLITCLMFFLILMTTQLLSALLGY